MYRNPYNTDKTGWLEALTYIVAMTPLHTLTVSIYMCSMCSAVVKETFLVSVRSLVLVNVNETIHDCTRNKQL